MNLDTKRCWRRRWNLTVLPCHHVISCINKLSYNVRDYVNDRYLTSNYKKCYPGIIFPTNGQAQWAAAGLKLKAPPVANMLGRPKKKRKHEPIDDLYLTIHEDGVSILTMKTR